MANSKGKDLIKNTGILAIGNIATKAITFLLLPLYTALLNAEQYGIIENLTTYVTLLVPIINLQLSQAIFRFATEKRDSKAYVSRVYSTSAFLSFGLLIVYTGVFLLSQGFLEIPFKWYLLIGTWLNIFMQMVSYAARGIGDNLAYSVGNFILGASVIFFNILFLAVFKMGIMGMLTSYCLGPILGITFITIRIRLWKFLKLEFCSFKEAKTQLYYSLPLVPNELSWWALNVSNKVVITYFLGYAATGLFSVAAKFSMIFSTVFSVFNASWTEQVVLHFHDDDGIQFIKSTINRAVRFFIALNLMIIATMPFVYPFMVNASYQSAYNQVPLFLIATVGQVFIGLVSPIYLVNNETKKVAEATVTAAIINVVADIILVRYIGVYAAAMASVIGYSVVAVIRIIDIQKRYFRLELSKKLLFSFLLMYVFVCSLYFYNNLIGNIIGWLACIVYCVYINKDLLSKIKAYSRNRVA